MGNCKPFLFLLVIFLIVSCSDDEDAIEGNWNLSIVALTSCPNDIPEVTINSDDGCVFLLEESLCINMRFTSDGTVSLTYMYDDDEPDVETGTYTDNNESIQICFDGECENLSLQNDLLVLSTIEDGCVAEYSFEKE